MKEHSSEFSIEEMSKVLEVSRSGYYDSISRPNSNNAAANIDLLENIEDIFIEHRQTYGYRRVWSALLDRGYNAGKNRIARLMAKNGIKACKAAAFIPQTTQSDHEYPVAANLLNQDFHVEKLNLVWTSDITYVRVGNTWCYLCVIIDLYNREIIGWSFENNMKTQMVIAALKRALKKRGYPKGIIFHSDRGVQFACTEFRELLKELEFKQSMSRKGNCYDNAPTESFFRTFKTEEVYRKKYLNFEIAKRNIFDYIEVFYNRIRKHSKLEYLSPIQYVAKLAA
jgi:transposase InsO family protein